jgi:hypothetical protein
MSVLDTTSVSLWRRLVLAHAWLAVSMSLWRVVESMPRTSSVSGGTFAASTSGRALALVTVIGGVVALIVVVVSTFRLRRDPRALALGVALAGALWTRTRFDVFDVTYLAAVAIAAALVLGRAPRTAAAAAPDLPADV